MQDLSIPNSVLFIVGSTALNKGDETVKARLERLGYVVVAKDGTNVMTTDAEGVIMVVISSTATAANVNTKFRDVEVPVIVANSDLFPEMGMTGRIRGTDYGDVPVATEIIIQNVNHPLSASLKERVMVYDLAAHTFFGKAGDRAARRAVANTAWGKPGKRAVKIAVLPSDQEKYTSKDKEPDGDKNRDKVVLFGYELCEQMEEMRAPARRVGLFLDSEVATNLTNDGWVLFDTAIRWAAGEEVKQFDYVFKAEWKEIQERRRGLYQDALLHVRDLNDPTSLAVKLRDGHDLLSQYLRGQLSPDTQRQLEQYGGSGLPSKSLQYALVDDLNQRLTSSGLFDEQRFAQVALTEKARHLIAQKPQGDDLIRLHRLLLEEAYPHEIVKSGGHCQPPLNLVGLALSGGGIRSATFNLGLLQGLYDLKALHIFDYLSTVSGGGYLGGWWSAWLSREQRPDIFPGPERIEPQRANRYLSMGEDKVAEGSMSAGIDPIHHLRLFANYLTPRKGVLSADTWRAIAVLTRNLTMTWLVLLPILVAFVLAGQLYFTTQETSRSDFLAQLLLSKAPARMGDSPRPPGQEIQNSNTVQIEGRPAPQLEEILRKRVWFAALPLVMLFGWMVVMVSLWMIRNNSGPWWLGALGALAVLVLIVFSLSIYAPEKFYGQEQPPAINQQAESTPTAPDRSAEHSPKTTVWEMINSPGSFWKTINSYGPLPLLWVVVAIILCIYALMTGGQKLRGVGAQAEQHWRREVQRNKIIRVHATLLVILVVTAGVLALSGFGHDAVEYIFGSGKSLVMKAGGWTAIISAIAGSIFTAVKGSPMGGGDQRVVSKPSLLSRIIFAITPPLVLLVLSMAAAWVAYELLAFIITNTTRVRPLAAGAFVGIGLCFIFAWYEMYKQKSPVPRWLVVLLLLFGADAIASTYTFAQQIESRWSFAGIGLAAFAGGLILWRLLVFETSRVSDEEQRSFEFVGLKSLFSKDLALVVLTIFGLLFTLALPWVISSWLADILKVPTPQKLLPIAVPIGLLFCALLVLVEMVYGRGNNRRALSLIAFPYLVLTTLLIVSFYPLSPTPVASSSVIQNVAASAGSKMPDELLTHVVVGLLAMVFAWVIALGWMADPNVLSLHTFYKARLVRAYLGASNSARRIKRREITEAVEGDDVALKDLLNCQNSAPYHLINTTLNLVGGRDLSTAQRSSSAFVLSKLYCGSTRTGYRETENYMGGRLTLGAAVAISGAAVSPNMGSLKTSASLAMLMTLLNVRLGYWAPTPNKEGWQNTQARLWPFYLLRESLSQTNDLSTFCHLTDGGHFENTGLYSLIERGCRYIVLSDSAADPAPCFADLGNAVRRCRIDFKTEIQLDITPFIKKSKEERFAAQHYTVGRIIYSEAHFKRLGWTDPSLQERTGVIVYIKPALLKNEREMDPDVRQYELENDGFPQQTTADQWFDEAQFESYRQLGYHCAKAAFGKIEVDKTEAYREVMKKQETDLEDEDHFVLEAKQASYKIRNVQFTSEENINRTQFTPVDTEKLFNFFYDYKPQTPHATG